MKDYHVHSNFSADCNYSMEDMVKAAISKNISTVSFTDHIDLDYPDPEYSNSFIFKPEDYIYELNRLKVLYRDDIKLIPGVEIGMQPHLVSSMKSLLPLDSFDFVLMSIHVAKKADLHNGDFFKNRSSLEAYIDYYSDLYYCVSQFNNYQTIGHINLIDRYFKYISSEVPFSKYSDLLVEVFKKIISSGKGIEVNTSGFRSGVGSALPNIEILKLYKSLGGEIITFGSDAHSPEDIGNNYDKVIDILKSLNFKYLSFFDNDGLKFNKI